MSMYGRYIKEHRNDEIEECDYGFASYRYLNDGKSVYIVDIWIDPDFRKSNLASELADKIVARAKKQGATELLGTVVPSANRATESLKVLLGYGMKLQSASNDLIIFRRDI